MLEFAGGSYTTLAINLGNKNISFFSVSCLSLVLKPLAR